jgi:16S rRNA (uracil1498-N3)-methyltransferase
MLPRFLAPGIDANSVQVELPADEAHHLTRVLRLSAGDEVIVFDGRGLELRGRVVSVGGKVTVASLVRAEPLPLPRVAITVVQSVIRAEAMDDVIRNCTMIGVSAIQPVVSERTSVKSSMLPKASARWHRIALASAKQCGRAALPEIRPVMQFADWLPSARGASAFLLVEPSALHAEVVRLRDLAESGETAASVIAGPEGGWTDAERDAALAAGCRALTLGPLTLRADMAPVIAAAALIALWQ